MKQPFKWLGENPQARRWVYGVAVAVVPILTAYGILSETQAPLWLGVVSAVLVPSLAWSNTPTPSQDPRETELEFEPEENNGSTAA